MDGRPEVVFAQAASGAQYATFIEAGKRYEFRLYQGTGHTGAPVIVAASRPDQLDLIARTTAHQHRRIEEAGINEVDGGEQRAFKIVKRLVLRKVLNRPSQKQVYVPIDG